MLDTGAQQHGVVVRRPGADPRDGRRGVAPRRGCDLTNEQTDSLIERALGRDVKKMVAECTRITWAPDQGVSTMDLICRFPRGAHNVAKLLFHFCLTFQGATFDSRDLRVT